ncbi:MAG: cytochrome c [Candidatus Binatia bacterium]
MRNLNITGAVLATMLAGAGWVYADSEGKLPAGPIHDRHELMEEIGDNAKIIGDALKSGQLEPVGPAAEKIHAASAKAVALFPKGSTHPKSRAKPEIWDNWEKFETLSKDFETAAGELAAAAKSGGDVKAAANTMFGTCKSCHDDFRKPEEKKGATKS